MERCSDASSRVGRDWLHDGYKNDLSRPNWTGSKCRGIAPFHSFTRSFVQNIQFEAGPCTDVLGWDSTLVLRPEIAPANPSVAPIRLQFGYIFIV